MPGCPRVTGYGSHDTRFQNGGGNQAACTAPWSKFTSWPLRLCNLAKKYVGPSWLSATVLIWQLSICISVPNLLFKTLLPKSLSETKDSRWSSPRRNTDTCGGHTVVFKKLDAPFHDYLLFHWKGHPKRHSECQSSSLLTKVNTYIIHVGTVPVARCNLIALVQYSRYNAGTRDEPRQWVNLYGV